MVVRRRNNKKGTIMKKRRRGSEKNNNCLYYQLRFGAANMGHTGFLLRGSGRASNATGADEFEPDPSFNPRFVNDALGVLSCWKCCRQKQAAGI